MGRVGGGEDGKDGRRGWVDGRREDGGREDERMREWRIF